MKQLKVSLENELRKLLDDAAETHGCSLGEEIRRRLWDSFGTSAAAVKYAQAWTEAFGD